MAAASEGRFARWTLVVLALSLACLLVSVYFWTTERTDGRRSIDLQDVVASIPALQENSREVTSDQCDREIDCTEAIDTEGVLLLKFDSQDSAAAAAAALGGDSRVAGWILMHFKADVLSAAERSEIAATVYCINVGPDPC